MRVCDRKRARRSSNDRGAGGQSQAEAQSSQLILAAKNLGSKNQTELVKSGKLHTRELWHASRVVDCCNGTSEDY
jgi:MinD superfamily P-loop ATPase